MKINKLSILFLLDKVKTNKQNKCPIKCRVTYDGKRKPFINMAEMDEHSIEQIPKEDNSIGREITEKEATMILNYLKSKGNDIYFEDILNEIIAELSNGSISEINELTISSKVPKSPKPKIKMPTNLGEVRKLYKNSKLFDSILPFVNLNADGNMITQHAKDAIILRAMTKFADASDNLTEKAIKKFILSIKGEYTNAGKLDQRYQN